MASDLFMMVVGYKKFEYPHIPGYVPMLVGNNDVQMEGAVRDNTGDNISKKNAGYCELTALYWAWKNVNDHKLIGLSQYRRYFTNHWYSVKSKYFLTEEQSKKTLESHDIIVAKPWKWDVTVAEMYYRSGNGREKDLVLAHEAINKLYPEYVDQYDSLLASKQACYNNMFVMNIDDFKKYCEWLFNILDYVEKNIDLTGYSKAEKRVFGYLGELLFNVWVNHNMKKPYYLDIVQIDKSPVKDYFRKNLFHIKHVIKAAITKKNK